jgi:DNA-binding transcriptional LysR family regulator
MSDIETRLFRYFVAVAEEQHFSRAAQRLGISPPTLTHQIKKLEDQLNSKLFNRRGNTNVELTEAGIRLLDIAQPILRQVDEAKFIVQRTARGVIGRIKVGYMTVAACTGVMQKLLAGFQRENPAVEIGMHRLVPMAQVTAIMRMDLDVGFTRTPSKYPSGVDGFEIYRRPLILALPSEHSLARRNKISPADLKDEVFINTGPELDVGFWGHTEVIAKSGKFTPHVLKRDDDMFTILTYVSLGYGIGVVPQPISNLNIPNIVYREITANPIPTSSIAFIYRRNSDVSPSANLLLRYMRRHAPPMLRMIGE